MASLAHSVPPAPLARLLAHRPARAAVSPPRRCQYRCRWPMQRGGSTQWCWPWRGAQRHPSRAGRTEHAGAHSQPPASARAPPAATAAAAAAAAAAARRAAIAAAPIHPSVAAPAPAAPAPQPPAAASLGGSASHEFHSAFSCVHSRNARPQCGDLCGTASAGTDRPASRPYRAASAPRRAAPPARCAHRGRHSPSRCMAVKACSQP